MPRRPLPVGDPPGPFRADQVPPKSPYEISQGHPVRVMPTGNRGSEAQLWGGMVIATDPAVARAGVDTGYAPSADTLRAPDVSIIPGGLGSGWVEGVPPLAIEYADSGQDEEKLAEKIRDLLAKGTQHVWVVRLRTPRHVEVHQPGVPMVRREVGEALEAPGLLSAPLRVEMLFDPQAALPVVAENALRKLGYGGIDGLREEGKAEGKAEGGLESLRAALIRQAERRGVRFDERQRARIAGSASAEELNGWLDTVVDGGNPLA